MSQVVLSSFTTEDRRFVVLSFGVINSTRYHCCLQCPHDGAVTFMSVCLHEFIRPIRCDHATCVTASGMTQSVLEILYKLNKRQVGQTLSRGRSISALLHCIVLREARPPRRPARVRRYNRHWCSRTNRLRQFLTPVLGLSQ